MSANDRSHRTLPAGRCRRRLVLCRIPRRGPRPPSTNSTPNSRNGLATTSIQTSPIQSGSPSNSQRCQKLVSQARHQTPSEEIAAMPIGRLQKGGSHRGRCHVCHGHDNSAHGSRLVNVTGRFTRSYRRREAEGRTEAGSYDGEEQEAPGLYFSRRTPLNFFALFFCAINTPVPLSAWSNDLPLHFGLELRALSHRWRYFTHTRALFW